MNRSKSSLQFARLVVMVLCAATAAAGCMPDHGRRVALRMVDSAGEGAGSDLPRTVAYPRVTLRDETRVVLSRPEPSALLSRTHLAARISLPPDSTLEFGYALNATKKLTSPVFFTVTLSDENGTRVVFETHPELQPQSLARWYDARVDLSAWRGEVEIVFQTSSAALGVDPSTGQSNADAYFSAPLITVRATEPKPRSLIVVSLDTLRADHLGIYGYARPTSVQIDRVFGEQGLTVERMFTNATTTLPGHAAMLFSLLPSVALELEGNVERVVAQSLSLAEVLRARGFRTAAFTENAYVTADLGFARGFETYVEEREAASGKAVSGHIQRTFDAALAWIERHLDEPFFVFVHTYQVHAPYTPPQRLEWLFPTAPGAGATAADLDNYDREIAYTDEEVGKLVARLRELGVLDETLLVVTSDHGEEFGEHGYRYHGPTLHDEVLRIPLLLLAPDLLPRAVRRSGPMSLVDLAPTVLELLGYPAPTEFYGASLAEHILSDAPANAGAIYSEAHVPFAIAAEGNANTWISPAFAVTAWPHRIVRSRRADATVYERYNLQTDPGEKNDIAAESGLADLSHLTAALESYETWTAAQRKRLAEQSPSSVRAEPGPGLDRQVMDKLRALGYME